MTNTQLIMTFIGWIVIFAISARTLRRNEISRVKDNLVKKIEDHLKIIDSLLKSDSAPLEIETISNSRCAQVEFYIEQLNYIVRFKLISKKNTALIRELDFRSSPGNDISSVSEIFYDLIEEIESEYFNEYLKTGLPRRIKLLILDLLEYIVITLCFAAITGIAWLSLKFI